MVNPIVAGAVYTGISNCGTVVGGTVEAFWRCFYQCFIVSGAKFKVDGGGNVFEQDLIGNTRYSNCVGSSAGGLLKVSGAASQVDLAGNSCSMSSASAYAVTNTVAARVRTIMNSLTGTGLTKSGTIADSRLNDWFGTTD